MSHNEETEAKAYINWLNIKLKGLGIKVSSLETDFKTGVNTNHLAQVLLKKEYRFLERPRSEFQFIQNNNQALGELRKDGCILHGSDGISMTNGNKPITRGFIWQLMLHYQINRDFPGKSIADARRDALKFINDALATLTEDETTQIRMLCGDFDKIDTPITCQSFDAISFHDGCVLAGLAVAINHSTRQETLAEIQKRCNDEKISPTQTPSEDPLVALTYASMCTAEERNEIPVLIDASDIVNAFEANSVLVYVSYYQHAKRDTAAAALASKLPPGMVPKDADFPLFDELEFLSKENNDKETHRDESHITSASQVSIDMPTMQQLQRDYDYLDQILRSFDSYCEKHGHFEENSHNSLLFSRIKAHHIRLSLDINNYQFSIQEIIKLHEEKIRLEVEMEEEKNRSAKEIETLRGEVTALQHKQHDNDIIIKGLRDNIESLSNQLKNNDNEHEKLLSEIEILKKNEQNNQEILSKLNSEVDLLKSTSVDLTNQLAHTTNAILANEAEKEVLNTQLSDNEAQKAILVENNEKLTKNLEHYQLIESNLDLELSKLRQEYDSLNGEHGGLKERLVDYNALVLKVHETDKLIAALQNELQEVKNHCERDHIVEIGSLKASIALLESKNKELSEDNKEKEDELGAKMIEIKNIKLGIAGKDEEIKKYQNEIEESKQQIEKTNKLNDGKKNDQILELRAEIQFKQGQNDKYVNQLDELMNKLKALEDDLKNEMELKELLIQQKNQIESKNSEQNLGLQESIKNLKKENDELNSQISLKDELISKLQLQIDDLGSQIAELDEELASLEQKYDELFAEKKELENKYNFLFEEALILKNDSENYEKLKNDYENSQKALSDFEAKYTLLDNLHNETLQSKQRDDRDSNSELIALKHAMGLLQTELAQKNDEIIQNGQKIKQLEDKIDEQNTQIGTKNEKIDELQRRIANNDAQITDLMQKLTGYDQNLKNLSDFEKQIENLREEIENQENKISKLEISLAAANATSTSIDSQITERDGVIADLKKKLHDVEKMKKDGDEKGEEVGERIRVLEAKIKQNDEEILTLKRTLAERDEDIKSLKEDNAKVKPLQEMNIKLKRDTVQFKENGDKLKKENDNLTEKNKLEGETNEKLLTEVEKLKKDNVEFKKSLQGYKKKNPDGTCGCSCCNHEDHPPKPSKKGEDIDSTKLKNELEAMKSKYNALKEETNQQREVNKKDQNDFQEMLKEQQHENDKLIKNIKKLQDKLKDQDRFDQDDDILTSSQLASSELRAELSQRAKDLLNSLKPQAGIVFSAKDPEDGGIKVSKVHINKAAYVAGITPAEVILTVSGHEVNKEKFAELWKTDAKAGSTLLLQVSGVNSSTNKPYHRTVRMDLGSTVASIHDIKDLKRMAQGIVKHNDEEVLNRVQDAQKNYENDKKLNPENNSSQGSSNLDDSHHQNSKPIPTHVPLKSPTTPSKTRPSLTALPVPTARSTPQRSSLTTTTTTTASTAPTPTRRSLTTSSQLIPPRTPVTKQTTNRGSSLTSPSSTTIPAHSSRQSSLMTPTRASINAAVKPRPAPPRGTTGPLSPPPDSKIMQQRRAETGKLVKEIEKLGE